MKIIYNYFFDIIYKMEDCKFIIMVILIIIVAYCILNTKRENFDMIPLKKDEGYRILEKARILT